MSARKRKTGARAPRRPEPPPRSRMRAVLWTVAVVVAVVIAWRARPRPAATPRAGAGLPLEAVVDSQRVALAARAWDRSLVWAEVLARRQPRNQSFALGVGLAWHNLAWGGSAYARPRAATRTSLERIVMEQRALALIDSATALARAPDDWARIRDWRAQILENLGLPVDALAGYDQVLRRVPDFPGTQGRARWVLKRLNDPMSGGEAPGGR